MCKFGYPTLHNVHVSCINNVPPPPIYNYGVQDICILCSLYLMMSICITLNKYPLYKKYTFRNLKRSITTL